MYFITCFSDCESEYDMDSRTFGFFSELSECYRALHENQCDMYEFCYEQAVIERIGEGIHAVPRRSSGLRRMKKGVAFMRSQSRNGRSVGAIMHSDERSIAMDNIVVKEVCDIRGKKV